MKTVPLTIRRCPAEVHQALKQLAKANRRSLNAEVLNRLELEVGEQAINCTELAQNLRKARTLMTAEEHREFAEDIARGIKLMRHERVH